MLIFVFSFLSVKQVIKGLNDLTINPVSLQKTVSFPQKCARKRCSYRNYWSMTIPGLKAGVFLFFQNDFVSSHFI